MKDARTWFLPEHVEEFTPPTAEVVDRLRRNLLDLYYSYGYRLVMPPILEYHSALVSGAGADLADITLNLYSEPDQQPLGIRSDFTPQVARIDSQNQVRTETGRYCYFGETLLTRPRKAQSIRNPFQAGVELIGSACISADLQMVELMLASIRQVTDEVVYLKLGHIAVFTRLCQIIGLDTDQQSLCERIIHRRSITDIYTFCQSYSGAAAAALAKLPRMIGDPMLLDQVQDYARLDAAIADSIDALREISQRVVALDSRVEIVIDFADLRGYSYHNAMLYSCYCRNTLLAQGGRYDGIGNYFGKNRSATGFSIVVNSLLDVSQTQDEQLVWLAYQYRDAAADWVKRFRQQGGRCLIALGAQESRPDWCTAELQPDGDDWQIVSVRAC